MATLNATNLAGDWNANFVIGDRRMVVQTLLVSGTYAQVGFTNNLPTSGGIRVKPEQLGLTSLDIAFCAKIDNGIGAVNLAFAGKEVADTDNLIFKSIDADGGETDAGSVTALVILIAFGR